MTVYCIVHHYGYSYNHNSEYDTNYMNERDLVAVLAEEELAKKYLVNLGLKLGGYCGRNPDWLNKKRTRFGYSVDVGPDEEEWDYYDIQEKNLLTELES